MAGEDRRMPLKVGLGMLIIGFIFYVVSIASSAWIKYDYKDADDKEINEFTLRYGLWETCSCISIHNRFRTPEDEKDYSYSYNSYSSEEEDPKLPGFYYAVEVLACLSWLMLWVLLCVTMCSNARMVYVKLVMGCITGLFLLLNIAIFGDQYRKAHEFDSGNNEYNLTGPDWGMGLAILALLLCIGSVVANAFEIHYDRSNPMGVSTHQMQIVQAAQHQFQNYAPSDPNIYQGHAVPQPAQGYAHQMPNAPPSTVAYALQTHPHAQPAQGQGYVENNSPPAYSNFTTNEGVKY